MWIGPIWKAPTVVPEPRRRRHPEHSSPADEIEGRPEFDFGPLPQPGELTGKGDGAPRKVVSAFITFLILLFMLPFVLVLLFFILACLLALWRGIFP